MGTKTFSFTAEYPDEDPDVTGTSVFFDAVIELSRSRSRWMAGLLVDMIKLQWACSRFQGPVLLQCPPPHDLQWQGDLPQPQAVAEGHVRGIVCVAAFPHNASVVWLLFTVRLLPDAASRYCGGMLSISGKVVVEEKVEE